MGKICAGGAGRIDPGQIEYETTLKWGRLIRLHRRCFVIWQEECEPDRDTTLESSG
jgi:hypothetical protein